MREDRISLRRSNVSRGNKTTVQLQNLLQPHRMTLPVKCLWQQQLFISDSYPSLGLGCSLHYILLFLRRLSRMDPKNLPGYVRSFMSNPFLVAFSYLSTFHSILVGFINHHQPAALVPCQCAVHVGGIAMLPHHDEGLRTRWPPRASNCLKFLFGGLVVWPST